MSMMSSLVGWLKQGYPTGVPEAEYVPLLAVLGRRLGEDEIIELSEQLRREGLVPATRADVGVGISRITDELPAPTEIDRVIDRLHDVGYPVTDEEFQRLAENERGLDGGLVIRRVRPTRSLDAAAMLGLLHSVGQDEGMSIDRARHALRRSHRVFAAWDADGRLVGLQRSISDGECLAYVTDTVVHPDVRGRGLERELLLQILAEYECIPVTIDAAVCTLAQRELLREQGFVAAIVAEQTLMVRPRH